MKISELQMQRPQPVTAQAVERREERHQGFSFKGEVLDINARNALDKLAEMNANINRQGEIVSKRCDITELKRYKEMIAEFMHNAVEFAFEFKKQSSLDARGRHRMYAIIKRINKKLEELTQQMLEGAAENIDVMNAIDEIRGLLLDLFL